MGNDTLDGGVVDCGLDLASEFLEDLCITKTMPRALCYCNITQIVERPHHTTF